MDEIAKAFAADGCVPCETFAEEPGPVFWAGPLTFEGVLSGDGRLIDNGALVWSDMPIPLRWVEQDVGAHDNAVVSGRIATIERKEGGVIWGTGDFDLGSDYGVEAARQVEKKLMNGVSVDLDEVSFQVRVPSDSIAPDTEDTVVADPPVDAEGNVVVYEQKPSDEVMVITSARIRAATLVAIPAFRDARIEIVENGVVVASAKLSDSERPPAHWFSQPSLVGPTPLTVTEDGRVFGHLAVFGQCHISHTHRGCVTPPRSQSSYSYFRTGAVLTDGGEVATGRITMNTTHASESARAAVAMNHYDDTGFAVADVAAGEDQWGIWIAGALRPGVTEEQIRVLRGSPLSGDWRRIGNNLELIGALAVNTPGFPIPRPSGLVASGHVQTLLSSGIVRPTSGIPDKVVALGRKRTVAALVSRVRKP